jgi:hypothetical protein
LVGRAGPASMDRRCRSGAGRRKGAASFVESVAVTVTEMSATKFWPIGAKGWVFIGGILVILLFALAWALGDEPAHRFSPERRKNDAEMGHFFYVYALLTWICIVNFLEFRRGLARLGLPDALTWALASIGVMTLIALTIVLLAIPNKSPWWRWTSAGVAYFAVWGGYLAVVSGHGLSAFLK